MIVPQAIERNRAALLAAVAAIAALIGGRDGDGAIARGLRRAALALLRPAEAAARRLIVVAARGLSVAPSGRRPPPPGLIRRVAGEGAPGRVPAFPLFDRWKRFRPMLRRVEPLGVPRIRSFWSAPQAAFTPAMSSPAALPAARAAAGLDGPVDAGRLRLRLRSLDRALADLPHQARRLARLRARRAASAAPPRSPLRPGRPPGWRQRPDRAVDEVLRSCHALACEALRPDTS